MTPELERAGGYRTIVADPPWRFPDGRGTGGSYSSRGRRTCELPYPTMTLEELVALPVAELAAPRSSLFLWTTNRHLRDAFALAEAWRFPHVATLVWCKQHGATSGGVFYSNVEFVLYCRRPNTPAPARVRTRWFTWSRSEHSAKPEAFLDLVEEVSPGPYLELFARRNRFGWDTYGDEALELAELVS